MHARPAMDATKLPITGPCPIDLDAIGFDRAAKVAHCSHCTKNVHVLSNMSRREARAFLAANKGKKLCVSYSCNDDGTIRFRAPAPTPEPALIPLTRLRSRIPTAARGAMPRSRAAGLVAALGVGAALAACTPSEGGERQDDRIVRTEQSESTTTKPEHTSKPITDTVADVLRRRDQRPDPQPDVKPDPMPEPDPMPLAGAAVIPEEMMDGEIEVPDPAAIGLDEPCDKTPKETETVETMAVAGMATL